MAAVRLRGVARVDRKTKELIARLAPGDIAVIDHADLDEVAADSLVQAGVAAVVNAGATITGRYPNQGPGVLAEAGVPLLDRADGACERVADGEPIEIDEEGRIWTGDKAVVAGRWLSPEEIQACLAAAEANLAAEADRFVDNTLEYARREKRFILHGIPLPPLKIRLAGRHAVVVVRGHGYRDDLAAISSYIHEVNPVLIGVDGGADALLECGYRPHLILGDMDSVSDAALQSGAEVIVHAYPDGRAPGLERVRALGVGAATVAAPGTSEDVALLLAYQLGASLIVAVGTHSNLIDFLEKGRPGMASTFLVRLRMGSHLVDARGVSQLYRGRVQLRYPLQVALAALVPIALVVALSDGLRGLLRLAWLQVRVWLGW